MTVENIVSVSTVAINLISIICYTIVIIVKGKKNAANTINQIIKTIPGYINIAKANYPSASTKTILNFVLAEIKDDFEEVITKKSESILKENIQKELEANA